MKNPKEKFHTAFKKCSEKAAKDPVYKKQFIENPASKLAEEGFVVPHTVKIVVHDDPKTCHMQLPCGARDPSVSSAGCGT